MWGAPLLSSITPYSRHLSHKAESSSWGLVLTAGPNCLPPGFPEISVPSSCTDLAHSQGTGPTGRHLEKGSRCGCSVNMVWSLQPRNLNDEMLPVHIRGWVPSLCFLAYPQISFFCCFSHCQYLISSCERLAFKIHTHNLPVAENL